MRQSNFSGQIAVGAMATLICVGAAAQVVSEGLSPASNTYRSYVDASIARDSGINQPLDLLNDFYPAVEVVISDHDNVRRRTDVEEEDLKMTVKPSLAYRTDIGRHQFYAAYTGVFTYHDELDQEDAQSNALHAKLGLDLSRRWDLNLFAGVGEAFEERGISGSRPFNQLVPNLDTGPDEIDYYLYGADLIYGRKSSPLIAVLGYEKYVTNYENNEQGFTNISGNRDRESDSVHLDISYQIGARTSVFGRIQYTEVDYDRAANTLDSEQTDFLLGLRWKPSNALSGVLGVGSTDKDFIDPARQDYDDNIYYVNLNYAFNPLSNLQLSASRVVEEPGDDQSDYYESDLLGIGIDHALTSTISVNAYAKWIDDNYNTNREDEFFDYGVGLDYYWRPWLTAGIYYSEIERKSTLDTVEYEDRYFGIRLTSDLRPLLRGRGSRVEPNGSFDYPRKSADGSR
ncbi:MAG: outer membrane beta-barrel protein [Pseudomonadota bacterium]